MSKQHEAIEVGVVKKFSVERELRGEWKGESEEGEEEEEGRRKGAVEVDSKGNFPTPLWRGGEQLNATKNPNNQTQIKHVQRQLKQTTSNHKQL